ncbi:MAG: ABC transporter permease [Oscillospiraceae bacterium]|nr:ABC transporter permease [Oscillospiraceae bacterium]
MARLILKRILLLIPVIVAVSFIVFALLEVTPGDVVDRIIAQGGELTPEDIEVLRAEHNLDRSMFYRYGLYMRNLVRGDLGVSDLTGVSVWTTFMQRLPYTLILSFSALIIGMAVAVPMGIIAARNAGKLADNAATVFTLVGMSMPVFWIGLLLIMLFAGRLQLLPAAAAGETPIEFLRSLIMPAICSGLSLTASTARQTRSSMLEVLKADFLRTASAKGVPSQTVIRKHALGNAWIPIITAAGASFCAQLAGSVVVESVFAWPGIGRMAAEAVFSRDTTTIMGTIILTTVLYVLVQMVVDILYAFIDPRIKSQYVNTKKQRRRVTA